VTEVSIDLRSPDGLLRGPAKPGLAILSRYAAILASIALHGVAIAWVQTRPAPAPDPVSAAPKPTIEILPPTPAPPEPVAVVLLEGDTVVPQAPSERVTPPSIAAVDRPSTVGPKTEAAATVTPSQPEPPRDRHPMMTMRQKDRQPAPPIDSGVSADFIDTFLKNSRPLAPKDNPTEQLQSDLATAESYLKNKGWVANATGEQVAMMRATASQLRDELYNRELQPDGTGRKSEHKTFKIKVAADGSATIHDKANVQRKGLGATFDVTDGLMRSHGIDPYSSYKLKILDETREERVAMGKQHRTQQLAMSAVHMKKNLERLWSMTSDIEKRKQGVFELWDDCAETGAEELVVGGRSARAYVVGFIRTKLPAGSELAFSSDEIERLNRQRKSQATFAPYL
jgi:hypothetical protein